MQRGSYWPLLFAVVGVAVTFVILALRYRARREPVAERRSVSDGDRAVLRGRGRRSKWGFVAFWVVSVSLIAAARLAGTSMAVEWAVFALVMTLASAFVAFHLHMRCPACGYRLGYQRSLGAPSDAARVLWKLL